jgi:hypothetical protein
LPMILPMIDPKMLIAASLVRSRRARLCGRGRARRESK